MSTSSGPVESRERNLKEWDYFLLWAGAAISLSEIWAGGLLASFGVVAGLLIIVLGHVIGNTPMALGGMIGSRHGVPAIVGTRGALGNRGSMLPAILNVVQLVGGTGVMLWIGGQAAAGLAGGEGSGRWWIVALGILTTLWAVAGSRVWRVLQKIGVVLLLLLTVAMTALALKTYGWRELLAAPAAPVMPFMLGLDLVIAMPISWMPLVSDYTRYAEVPGRGIRGTWWGYFLVGSWMYAVGLVASVATGSDAPESMLLRLMGEHRLLVPAVGIVLLSTLTTTFLDIYSNAVSAQSLLPRLGTRPAVVMAGVAGTIIALLFDATKYEGFLLLIGSAFCPLFGVVLADYFILKRGRYVAEDLYRRGRYWYRGGVNFRAVAAWAVGIAGYHLCAKTAFAGGSSIPSMAVAVVLYVAISWNQRGKA